MPNKSHSEFHPAESSAYILEALTSLHVDLILTLAHREHMRHQLRVPPQGPLLGSPIGGEDQGPMGKREGPGCKRVGPRDSSNPFGKDLLSRREKRVWMKMVSRAGSQAHNFLSEAENK